MPIGLVCLSMVGAMCLYEQAPARAATSTTSTATPPALSAAIRKALDTPRQLGATYTRIGAVFSGVGVKFTIGGVEIGRGAKLTAITTTLVQRTRAAAYVGRDATNSFTPVSGGIEQMITITQRPTGRGGLVAEIPVGGLTAVTIPPSSRAVSQLDSGVGMSLRRFTWNIRHRPAASATTSVNLERAGQIRATYSSLKVVDATGRVIPASMRAVDHGHAIAIRVDDHGARYPLTVDPTWSQTDEFSSSDGAAGDLFGASVSISGTTALVGAAFHTDSGTGDQGDAYIFTESGNTWVQQAELAPTVSDGEVWEFGASVALSGDTAVIGAPEVNNGVLRGAVYVFIGSGASWSQVAALANPDYGAYDDFGGTVAVSGDTIVAGADCNKLGGSVCDGAAYIFTGSGSSWTLSDEYTNTATSNEVVGQSVATDGSTVVVGAINAVDGAGYASGAVYVLTESDGVWSQSAELTPSDGAVGDEFGYSVLISGSTIVVGAVQKTIDGEYQQGAVYVFTESGSVWTQAAELTDPNGVEFGSFGESVALSGSTLLVVAPEDTADGNAAQGAVYAFNGSGASWTQTAEFTASNGAAGLEFGESVAFAGSVALVTEVQAPVDGRSGQGAVYAFDSTGLISPQGSTPSSDESGGGSVSEPCQCAGVPVTQSVGDPVDTATGDLYQTSTDLTLPGAGVPLTFTRTYDAQQAQSEAAAGSPTPPLGYGWSTNLGMNMSYNATTQVATVTEENGAQVTFSPYVSGSSPAWCSGSTNFCAIAPRMEATLNQNGDDSWTYVRNSGAPTTFSFSSAGALTSMTDQQGDTLSSSTYSPSGGQTACPSSNTCVAWTSSASGRELAIATNGSGEITEVFDANSSLAATFSYSGTGCSTWSSGPVDLCSVTDPGSLVESFTYDSANTTVSFDYDMLTDTSPGGSGQTTNVYNTMGQATQQTNPAGDVTTFAYAGTNSSLLGGTTTLTNYPLGTGTGEPQDVTVDTYSSNVLVGVTTGYGTSFASSEIVTRDPASLMPLAIQDGDGNSTSLTYQTYSGSGGTETSSGNVLTSTDAVGNTTAYAYNGFNQAWCSVDAADYANGARCPSSAPTSPPALGVTDPNLGLTINFYNSSDQLTATTDARGNTTTYAYTAGVSGVPNSLLYCTVDPVSYQESVTCPAYGATHVTGMTTSTFDSAGDTLTSTNADGDTTTYVYAVSGHPGLVSSETDPDGTVTTFTYNGAGQVTSQVVTFQSYSATTLDAYDSFGRQYCSVASAEAALGVTCPSSPPSSPPTVGSDSYLGTTITTFNANGQVVQVTNPLGGISYTAYDEAGETFCSVAPAQAALGVACPSSPPSSPPTVGSDSYLGTTIKTFNANGQVIQVTNPLGGITLTTYDGAGNVMQTTVESNDATSAPNIVTNYTYDADNRVVSTTVDSGGSVASTTLKSYEPDGNVYCSVSANAYASGNYQCAPWQAAWIVSPPSPSAFYSSTPTSAQANNVTMSFYNANGSLVQSTNPDVQTSISSVDGDGRTYCTSDPVNVASWLTANPSGTYPYLCPSTPPSTAPSTGSDPGYVTTIFDSAGNTLSSTNQLGDTTSYAYDAAGHVLTTTDPRGEVTTNCYYDENGSGACAHATPAAGGTGDSLYSTTTPATTADPSGETTTYTYFPGGASDTATTPAGTSTKAYDAMGDLLSTTYSGVASGYSVPTTTSDTYNVDGTVHTMIDASGTTTYAYDAMGDVTSQALVAAGGSGLVNATTSYSYFTTGVMATLTYPAYTGHSDPVVTYAYDATGAMISSTDWLGNEVTYAHDHDGNQTSQDNAVSGTYPSGTSSTAFTYDAANDNTAAASTLNQTCGSSETLTQSFSGSTGSRNADGQLTEYTTAYSATCSGQTGYERNYSYDQAGDVIFQGSAVQGSSANNFAYDASGDPTTISSHSGSAFDTYTQTFDAVGEVIGQSPISGSGGVTSSYTYDTLGDQVKDVSTTTTTYAFNAAGQMVSATTPSGTTTYLYNGDGLEASATSPGVAAPFWNSPVDVNSTRAFDVVDCLSATFCVAVGASGYATTWNGTSWSTPTDADSTRTMDALDCVSTTFCVAVDTSGYATIYNGSTWSTPSDVDSTRSVDAVSCTSSTFCVAVGASGYAAKYTGTWASATDIDSTRTIDAVACTSTTFCVTGDTLGYSAKYTGTWASASDIDSSRSISTIACTSSTFCVTGDTMGYSATYTGSWATATDIDSSRSIKQVVCESSTFCVAIGSAGYAATYTGSWATATDIDGSTVLESISCVSTTYCVASDGAGNVLAYSGTWGSAKSVDAARVSASISCPTMTFCAAVDASGYATLYQVATQAWAAASDVNSTRAFDVVDCLSATFCVAVGASGYATTWNGATWSAPTDADSTRTMDALDCVSTTFCVAVDTSGYATIYNGSTWSTPSDIDSTRSVNAVSCTSSTFCVAVGASGYAAIYTGSWALSSDVDSTRTMDAVACVSTTFCVTGDTTGYSAKYTGTWASATDIDSSRSISTIACASTTFCVTGDTTGYSAKYTGSWAAATDIDSSRSIKQVVCESSTFCVAIGSAGYAATYTGSWATATDIDGSTVLESISCVTTTYCVVSDGAGNVLTYNGSAWSYPAGVDATRSISSVSCPTTTFCAAVDASGYATTYAPVPAPSPTVSQLTWNATGSLSLILSDGNYDYIYGPSSTPVEEISLATSVPTYMTYTPSDSTWFTTNAAGDETGFYGFDAFGTLAFGSPTSTFDFAGQYTDGSSGFSNMRARFYDAQTGSFTTRDPAFNATDTAYIYAGDDPISKSDPTGQATFGVCGNLSAQIAIIGGLGGTGTLCLVRTVFTPQGNDDIGFTETVGMSAPGLGASAGVALEYQISNANHLQDLSHWFWNATFDIPIGAPAGLSANAGVFWGEGSSNQSIYGVQGGIGLGAGGGAYMYKTNTWVQQVNGTIQANLLRFAWDALVPSSLVGANTINGILSKAKSKTQSIIPMQNPHLASEGC